ncbi:hypothetical protein SFRURICE_008776 [Spodoptera frugiperda]|nr:hypothetical protein SFRURICE_008776 [Spodoptera frugiperda]
MFRIYILLCGLSLTEAYSVKVSGQMELGTKLSKLIVDLYKQLEESGVIQAQYLDDDFVNKKEKLEISQESGVKEDTDFTDKTRQEKKHKKKRDKRVVPSYDQGLPVLDKMVKNDLEKLHLYGYHKSPDKDAQDLGKPLNNVHI